MGGILFVSWPGAGNQVPASGLATTLTERGYDITFAGYADQRDRFAAHGHDFRLLERAQRAWPTTPPTDWMPALVDAVWACRDHVDDVAELLGSGAYDAMVVDCLMFGALAGASRHELPTAVLVHSAPGALLPPGGGLDHLALAAVNEIRTDIGLPAVARLWDTWRDFATLCTSVPELDPLAPGLPESFEYVGPLFEPSRTTWESPWRVDDDRPLVLVSFSTGMAWDQRSRIRRTVDALADGTRRILVTTGPFDVSDLADRPGVVLAPYVPHDQVLPAAAVMVTHAGHGTVAASLAHGVPIVALPNVAADQPALAAHLDRLGAGIALDGDDADPAQIADAVRAVVEGRSYASAARAIAARIADAPGPEGAADRLVRLAQGVSV
ncbi:glycosyltransferase [Solicola gregarius]|uniref:Glycosyltransferase n=1 Tax=Solicola gregarius TaxID=2908642 RepID=A0AA46YME3_9ACTN|nr:glycosyltransferase [Solicola gregarius]UYM06446.1 glycosyltransferase [Solicola gregarius]